MKKILKMSLISSAILPTVISAGCSSLTNKDLPKDFHELPPLFSKIKKLDTTIKFEKSKVEKYTIKAKITKSSDGDTFSAVALEDKFDLKQNDEIKIRVASIDTPEKNVGGKDASKYEKEHAEKSSKFGEQTLKKGKEVYLFLTAGGNKDSFGRTTSDIMFSYEKDKLNNIEDANRSYSVEIVKAGLSLPMDSSGPTLLDIESTSQFKHYTYYLIALSLKYALDNYQGFFSEKDVYKAKNPYRYISYEINKIKPIGEGYSFFVFNKDKPYEKGKQPKNSIYNPAYYSRAYKPAEVVYDNGETWINGKLK